MPYMSHLCLAHFHFISIHQLHPPSVDATNAPTPSWMIWSNTYHHMTSLVHRSWPCLLFTIVSVHRCQVLLKLHRLAVPRFKALTYPSPLQPVHQAKSCLDLLHFGHITSCHVSYAMSSLITLSKHQPLAISPPWHMLLILMSLCGLISYVSQHKHLLVHLSCHSIIKTKQGPFSRQQWSRVDSIGRVSRGLFVIPMFGRGLCVNGQDSCLLYPSRMYLYMYWLCTLLNV